jgi:hypothetical protein
MAQRVDTNCAAADIQRAFFGLTLSEARPVVANAAADPTASPWQVKFRSELLNKIDAALAKVNGVK